MYLTTRHDSQYLTYQNLLICWFWQI